MSQKTDSSKRKTVKAMLGTSGLTVVGTFSVDKWVRPIISTAVVPVHAQTSCTPTTFSIDEMSLAFVPESSVQVEVNNLTAAGFEATVTVEATTDAAGTEERSDTLFIGAGGETSFGFTFEDNSISNYRAVVSSNEGPPDCQVSTEFLEFEPQTN